MPELPEVETVKRSLEDKIINKKITDILIRRESALKNINIQEISKLKNTKISKIKRYAKYICLELSNDNVLVIHLKMTGNVLITDPAEEYHKHDHIVFTLSPLSLQESPQRGSNINHKYSDKTSGGEGSQQIRFRDTRCFGYIAYYSDIDQAIEQENIKLLAPEPLSDEFTLEHILSNYHKYKSNIKSVLLDQRKLVSGLGNIYVDESLFRSGIHPDIITNTISQEQLAKLHKNIKVIIKDAIEQGGTSFRDYVDANGKKGKYSETLYVYGRKAQECKVCNSIIEYKKTGGRGTHYCPTCQPI